MKQLFACADQYVKESDWRDLALIKFCLFSVGLLAGLCVTRRETKKPLLFLSSIVFVITYLPLMIKFIRILLNGPKQAAE